MKTITKCTRYVANSSARAEYGIDLLAIKSRAKRFEMWTKKGKRLYLQCSIKVVMKNGRVQIKYRELGFKKRKVSNLQMDVFHLFPFDVAYNAAELVTNAITILQLTEIFSQ